MSFTAEPERIPGPTSSPYSTPSRSDLAAVAVTVTLVGVLMALLITWLAFRLRRSAHSQPTHIPIVTRRPASNATYIFRPSFAPSDASSKLGFPRKPLRLSHQRQDGSWDFVDSDPSAPKKEGSLDPPVRSLSQKHRPAPLVPTPAYTPRTRRSSIHKGEFSPTTPTSAGCIESPPPAYYREKSPWAIY